MLEYSQPDPNFPLPVSAGPSGSGKEATLFDADGNVLGEINGEVPGMSPWDGWQERVDRTQSVATAINLFPDFVEVTAWLYAFGECVCENDEDDCIWCFAGRVLDETG